MKQLIRLKKIAVIMFFAGTLLSGSPAWAAEGIILKVADSSGKYCHLKFPAISPETLYSDHPVMKDPKEGDIIDYYGSCDHDPLGKDEVLRQRADAIRERNRPRD